MRLHWNAWKYYPAAWPEFEAWRRYKKLTVRFFFRDLSLWLRAWFYWIVVVFSAASNMFNRSQFLSYWIPCRNKCNLKKNLRRFGISSKWNGTNIPSEENLQASVAYQSSSWASSMLWLKLPLWCLRIFIFSADKNDDCGENATAGDRGAKPFSAGAGDITCDILSLPVSSVVNQLKSQARLQLKIILQKPS